MRMLVAARVVAVTVMLAVLAGHSPAAKADTSFGFYVGRPGFSFYFDRAPRYRYRPYYYAPRPYYRAPRSYRARSCDYWSARCGANWGYGNKNYRGCMRYYGCL
jgi:hypothetical protein